MNTDHEQIQKPANWVEGRVGQQPDQAAKEDVQGYYGYLLDTIKYAIPLLPILSPTTTTAPTSGSTGGTGGTLTTTTRMN